MCEVLKPEQQRRVEETLEIIENMALRSREMEPELVEPIGQTFDGGPDIVPLQAHEKTNR